MSMSYGFTNFTWIWLCLSKDEHLPEWSLLILSWWVCCPLLTQTFVLNAVPIVIQRTTGAYHGYMALILFVGYLGAIVYDLRQQQKEQRINLPWLLSIGVLVQFGWEAALLLGGIRSAGFATAGEKLHTLVVNSLLETNLGMPYVYGLYIAYPAALRSSSADARHRFLSRNGLWRTINSGRGSELKNCIFSIAPNRSERRAFLMTFTPSSEIKVSVLPEQREWVGTPEMIGRAVQREDTVAFDIWDENQLVGFVLLRKFQEGEWFLWEYVIDCSMQRRGYGRKALGALIRLMQERYGLHSMTTTYIWGNTVAAHLYESLGFVETDVVDEPDCHEVNMIFHCV